MLNEKSRIFLSGLLICLFSTKVIAGVLFTSQIFTHMVNADSKKAFKKYEKPLQYEEVQLAKTVRTLIDSMYKHLPCGEIISLLRSEVSYRIMLKNQELGNRILEKLSKHSTYIKHCLYLADMKLNMQSLESQRFIFYFEEGDAPDDLTTHEWDKHYENLSNTFDSKILEKIAFKIEKSEKYGRAFPPWDVCWGLRQKELGKSPHELIHLQSTLVFRQHSPLLARPCMLHEYESDNV